MSEIIYKNPYFNYTARKEEKDTFGPGDPRKIADHIEYIVTGKNQKSNDTIILEAIADETHVSVGAPLIIDYVMSVTQSVTVQGFLPKPEVKGYLLQRVENSKSDIKKRERSNFDVLFYWDNAQNGASVVRVEEGTPGWGVLKPRDQILSVGGKKIKSARHLNRLMLLGSKTKETKFVILRNGEEKEFLMVAARTPVHGEEPPTFGFSATYDPDKSEVFVRDARGSTLVEGDVLLSVDGAPIRTMSDWSKVQNYADENKAYAFVVSRQGQQLPVEIRPSHEKRTISYQWVLFNHSGKMKSAHARKKNISGVDYHEAKAFSARFVFGEPGVYTIDPGSLLVSSAFLNLTTFRAVEAKKPIEVTVHKPKGNIVNRRSK